MHDARRTLVLMTWNEECTGRDVMATCSALSYESVHDTWIILEQGCEVQFAYAWPIQHGCIQFTHVCFEKQDGYRPCDRPW